MHLCACSAHLRHAVAQDEAVFQDFGRSRQQQPGDDGTSASLYRYEPSPQDWLGPPIPPTPEIRSRR